jgi:hypothetical protein
MYEQFRLVLQADFVILPRAGASYGRGIWACPALGDCR